MKTHRWLLVILGLGAFLRLWMISSIPPSPSLDEVSIGWNAYSLIQTGMDEYGNRFPLLLRAYDDWRPALYVYLVMPFVKLLGLSTFSVRIPSVLLSIGSLYATYVLGRALFKKDSYGLFAAGILTLSPWHIYISRLGHEANAGLAFLIFGLALFYIRRYWWSTMLFALSFMSYQPQKLIVPIVVLTLLIVHRSYFLKRWRMTLGMGFVGLLITLPFIIVSLSPEAAIRFRATNIFSSEVEIFHVAQKEFADAKVSGDFIGQILNHRYIVGSTIAVRQYVSHFSLSWLIANSGSEPHKVPGLGIVYWWELIAFGVGLFMLIRSKKQRIVLILCSALLFSAPITAALTTGAPHAMRSYTAIPALQIVAAFGLYVFIQKIKIKKIVWIVGGSIVIVSIYTLWTGYFIRFPQEQSDSFQYAYTHAIPYIQEQESRYDSIVISNQDNLYQSYMFYLFHTNYNPQMYLSQGGTVSGGYAEEHTIGSLTFKPLPSELAERTLYVGNISDIPEGAHVQKTFYNRGGEARVVAFTKS